MLVVVDDGLGAHPERCTDLCPGLTVPASVAHHLDAELQQKLGQASARGQGLEWLDRSGRRTATARRTGAVAEVGEPNRGEVVFVPLRDDRIDIDARRKEVGFGELEILIQVVRHGARVRRNRSAVSSARTRLCEVEPIIVEARSWLAADLLTAQRILTDAEMPSDVPTHVEVLTDILDDELRYTLDWRLTVAYAILAARNAGQMR